MSLKPRLRSDLWFPGEKLVQQLEKSKGYTSESVTEEGLGLPGEEEGNKEKEDKMKRENLCASSPQLARSQ